MPTYDYQCDGCGCQFEKFQSMTARPVKKCPQCGENKARRLIGMGAGVIFKGSGFYQTDYRNGDYKKAAEAEEPKADEKPKDAPAKSESKSDSAPAKKEKPEKPKSSKKD